VEARHGIVLVVFAREQRGELQLPDVCLESREQSLQLPLGVLVGGLLEELVENLGLLESLGERFVPLEIRSEPREVGR
jgi:hypothetical protein